MRVKDLIGLDALVAAPVEATAHESITPRPRDASASDMLAAGIPLFSINEAVQAHRHLTYGS